MGDKASPFASQARETWKQVVSTAEKNEDDFAQLAAQRRLGEHILAQLNTTKVGADVSEEAKQSMMRRKLAVFYKLIGQLFLANLHDSESKQIEKVITTNLNNFVPPNLMASFVEYMVEQYDSSNDKQPILWPIFVRLLVQTSALPLVVDSTAIEMPGQVFKSSILVKVNGWDWTLDNVTIIIANLREVPMTPTEIKNFLTKSFKSLPSVAQSQDGHLLAPACNHLMEFSEKGESSFVLRKVISMMEELETQFQADEAGEAPQVQTAEMKKLLEIEADLMFYVDGAFRKNSKLGAEFLKLLKDSRTKWTPFLLKVATTMLRSTANLQQAKKIEDALKSRIESCCKTILTDNTGFALPDLRVGEGFVNREGEVKALFETLITHCKTGGLGDRCLAGITKLGFSLADLKKKYATPEQNKASDLGSGILLDTFTSHEDLRVEILGEILKRVKSNAESSVQVLHLLSAIAKKSAADLRKYSKLLQETIGCIGELAPGTAQLFIQAIVPELNLDKDTLEYLMVTLRKLLFNKDSQVRIAAAAGFVSILKMASGVLRPLGATQAAIQPTQHSTVTQQDAIQVLEYLQRSLSQQASVREAVYRGLLEAYQSQEESLRAVICEILAAQVANYLDESSVISLSATLGNSDDDEPLVTEPLPVLLQVVQAIARDAPEELADQMRGEVEGFINSLLEKDLEYFKIDKSTVYDLTTAEGRYNHQLAAQYFGSVEAFVEFYATPDSCAPLSKDTPAFPISDESIEQICHLLNRYHQLKYAIKGKSIDDDEEEDGVKKEKGKKKTSGKGKGKGKGKAQASSEESNEADDEDGEGAEAEGAKPEKKKKAQHVLKRQPIFTDACYVNLIRKFLVDNIPDLSPKQRTTYATFLMTSFLGRIKALRAGLGSSGRLTLPVKVLFGRLLHTLWECFTSHWNNPQSVEAHQKPISLLALDCVVELMPLFWKNSSDPTANVVAALGNMVPDSLKKQQDDDVEEVNESQGVSVEEQVASVLTLIEGYIKKMMAATNKTREAEALLKLYGSLLQFLPSGEQQIERQLRKLDRVATGGGEKALLQLHIVELLWTTAPRVGTQVHTDLLAKAIAEMRTVLPEVDVVQHGDEVKEEPLDEAALYHFTLNNVKQYLTAMASHLNELEKYFEAVVTGLKVKTAAEAAVGGDDGYDSDDDETGDVRTALHMRLRGLFDVITRLASLPMPLEVTPAFGKLAIRTTKLIISVTADVTAVLAKNNPKKLKKRISRPFEDLLKQVEPFIVQVNDWVNRLYVQVTKEEQRGDNQAPLKKKATKGKQKPGAKAKVAKKKDYRKDAPQLVFWLEKFQGESLAKLLIYTPELSIFKKLEKSASRDFYKKKQETVRIKRERSDESEAEDNDDNSGQGDDGEQMDVEEEEEEKPKAKNSAPKKAMAAPHPKRRKQ